MPEILRWNEISDKYQGGTLLLGNGASMAIHSGFGYASLRAAAEELGHINPNVVDIFDAFGTNDFELVLRRLWQAKLVNQALKVEPGKVEEAYLQVREALIATVRDIHIPYDDTAVYFEAIYTFLKRFKTVLSLNYDLVVYWAMLAGNDVLGRWFKDGFQHGRFREDWKVLHNSYGAPGATLVFYPHGNLITARSKDYTERKLASAGGESVALLDRILEQWESEEVVPLFISEGTSGHKKQSIMGSDYLARVYREVLPSAAWALVIYGWSMSDQDRHILEQIVRASPARIAISVHGGNQDDARQMEARIRAVLRRQIEIVFFDAGSPGCWIHPN